MKTKLAFFAAIIITGIGSTAAIAGRDWNYSPTAPKTSATTKPAAMGCCAMGSMPHTTGGMDCHAAKEESVAKPKSCCK